MVLKDEALYPSNCFQLAAELIIEFSDRKEPFLLLQQDGGHEYNPTTPRNILATIMICIACQLEHIISIKNAGGCSIYNPIERPMSTINYCCMGLSCSREESSVEVEEGIRKAKSVQEFIMNNKDNKKVIKEYTQSVQPCIDNINDAVSQGVYAGKRIKIGKIAEKEDVTKHMDKLKSILTFLPDNLFTCNLQDIFGSDAGKEFLRMHIKMGRYITEIYRNGSKCSCSFCSMPAKSKETCKGYVPYPVKINKDEYSKFVEPVPLGFEMKETDCPSMVENNRKGRFHVQLNSLNKSTVLGFTPCILCGKVRILYGPRRHVPKAMIVWLIDVYLPAYQYQCGQPLYPDNDIDRVELPCEEWRDERCRVEIRHNLFCSTPIESQVSIIF